MHHNDARRRLRYGGSKHLARVHERAVENPARDEEVGQHLALSPQGQNVELLDGQVAERRGAQAVDICRSLDPLGWRLALDTQPASQLQGGGEPAGFGTADPWRSCDLDGRAAREAAQRAVDPTEQRRGDFERVAPRATRTKEYGDELLGGEGT